MRRTLVIAGSLVLGLAVIGATGYALAEPGVRGGMRGLRAGLADRPIGRLIQSVMGRKLVLRSEMKVTEEQREEIRAIVESHKAELVAAVKPIVASKRALGEAVAAEETNEAAIRSACEDLGKSLGDAAVLGAKIRKEVAGVLTAEQQELLEGFRSEVGADVDAWLGEISKEG